MNSNAVNDPVQRMSRSERRGWRRADRRAVREHENSQLEALRDMAHTGSAVTSMLSGAESDFTGSVEMIIEGRRLRAARVYRPTLAKLKEALGSIAAVPLLAVGRYGPYWVLTFKVATETLVVLADRITLLPEWGGTNWLGVPVRPAGQLVG
jgi:hypothetical protein